MKLFLTMLLAVTLMAFNSVSYANSSSAQRNELVKNVSECQTTIDSPSVDVTYVATMVVGFVVALDDATPFPCLDFPYTGRDFSMEVDHFDNPSGFV